MAAAGIYMLSCKDTGQSYIGASRQLRQRLEAHRSMIRCRYGDAKFLAAFPSVEQVEFRVLEYVKIPPLNMASVRTADKNFSAQRRLLHRERHWIVSLQPTLNIRKRNANVRLEELPVGAPA